ncbi:peptidoglycan editing factor PgeF [Candidatus Peregrinibacteria bacterium]|nr:peptidoglycan editing factor PgeF [Candidatus Peregrinibacteria bacterium]
MIDFKIFNGFPEVVQGMTTKDFGSLNSDENGFQDTIKKLQRELSLPTEPHFLRQVHGNKIHVVNTVAPLSEMPEADVLITQLKGVPLMIKVADCQALLFYDPTQHVIAAVHAGWRGLVADIIATVIRTLVADFDSRQEDLLVAAGPSLGPCCATFTDPHRELPPRFSPYINSENHVDLWAFTQAELHEAGVPPSHIELMKVCTQSSHDLCFSARAGDTGRMGAVIMM